MKILAWIGAVVLIGMVGTQSIRMVRAAEAADDKAASKAGQNEGGSVASAESKADPAGRVSVAVARDRAKLMHGIYLATLEVMHHRYFHGDRAVVPARAMEDVFSEMKRQSKAEARWISVNTKAMSIDHEPKSEFEKRAALEIAAGKTEVELVDGGYYRRAGAVPLTSGCIHCHEGFFKEASKSPKFAGLVISVPVQAE